MREDNIKRYLTEIEFEDLRFILEDRVQWRALVNTVMNLRIPLKEEEFLTESTLFWEITPCSPLKVNRRFGGMYHLRLQGRSIS
jgi:hypothetical protein